MNKGQTLKHKHYNIEIELVEPTSKGWKVLQLDKTIKPRNTKWVTKHFSDSEIRNLFENNEIYKSKGIMMSNTNLAENYERFFKEKLTKRRILAEDSRPDGMNDSPYYDNDGWNEETFDELGLMDALQVCAAIEYEIKNARRGSYGISGDTIDDLLSDLRETQDVLGDVIRALEREVHD